MHFSRSLCLLLFSGFCELTFATPADDTCAKDAASCSSAEEPLASQRESFLVEGDLVAQDDHDQADDMRTSLLQQRKAHSTRQQQEKIQNAEAPLAAANSSDNPVLFQEGISGGGIPPEYWEKYDFDNLLKAGALIWTSKPDHVVHNEGRNIKTAYGLNPDACGSLCKKTPGCRSFSNCYGKNCYLKTASISASTPTYKKGGCASFYEAKLGEYAPKNPDLLQPSSGRRRAETYTFYAYRSDSYGPNFPVGNVNLASLDGALWYLHNEIIFSCNGAGTKGKKWGDRKFSISRLKRFKITYRPTNGILKLGMNFGPLKSFDFGEATGPHRDDKKYGKGTGALSNPEWDKYGFVFGCGKLGEWPHQDWASGKRYKNAVWFSVPGSCPNKPLDEWSAACLSQWPGGWCKDVTGQGNCTFSYEEAGEIDIDTLVGIKPRWRSRADFCSRCRTEGSPYSEGGCGLRFWHNIWSNWDNQQRHEKADRAFKEKYPHLPSEADLPAPACDFNKNRYWADK